MALMVRESQRAGNAVFTKAGRPDAPRRNVCSEMGPSLLLYTLAHAFFETGKETFSGGRYGLHLPRLFRADGAAAQSDWNAHEGALPFRANAEAGGAGFSAGLSYGCVW